MEHQQVISCATAIARDLDMPEALIDIEAEYFRTFTANI